MTAVSSHPVARCRDGIRATWEAYDLRGTEVVMVADPENEHAWIQSDAVVDRTL